jgi:hypothetical protein
VKHLKKFQKLNQKSRTGASVVITLVSLLTLASFVETTDSSFTSSAPVIVNATAAGPAITSAADIVAYDPAGQLWNFGPVATDMTVRTSIGAAGAAIPAEFFVTDWNSDGIQDLVMKQKDGQLILRKGLPFGGFNDSNIGNGWQDFEITIGKWRKTDPNPSIVAKHTPTADLYHYPNSYGTTLDPRVPIGAGWGPFYPLNMIDFDQDGNMDIVARKTTTDEMLLYRSNGTGGFLAETRPVIGNGWNMYDSIRVVRGRGGAGHVGLLARGSAAGNIAYYEAVKNGWLPAVHVSNGWSGYKIAGN